MATAVITPEQILKLLGIEYQYKSGRLAFCCPIHADTDPSAAFYLDTALAHCFSCEYTLPPVAFYCRVKWDLDEQPQKDARRDLERIFGTVEEKKRAADPHVVNSARAKGERVLAELRGVLPREDHAYLGELLDRALLHYERDRITKARLDTILDLWYTGVGEAKSAKAYPHRVPATGQGAWFEDTAPAPVLETYDTEDSVDLE